MVNKSQPKLAFYPELQYSQLYSETHQATLQRMPVGAEIYATVCDDRYFFFFWPCCIACGILVSQARIESESPAMETES